MSIALPARVDLPVPFLCQAPSADWSMPWQEACEEAAIIMAIGYVSGSQGAKGQRGKGSEGILELVRFQEEKYGGHYDLTAEQAAQLIRDFYHYENVEVRYDFTVNDIKTELARGNPVIAPMAGRKLGNPYYTPPGPAYHYLLFRGYDEARGEFITNDPGTRRGKGLRYKYRVAYDAIRDWTGSKRTINSGRKALLVVKYK